MSLNDTMIFILDIMLLIFDIFAGFAEFFYRLVVPVKRKSLINEVAIVTGAGHGIGRQLALQLAHQGVAVICWDINETTGRQTSQAIKDTGHKSWFFRCDISDQKQVEKAAQESRRCGAGTITMLFNNAGVMPCKPFLKHDAIDIEKTFKINVFGQMYTLFEFLPEFYKNNNGHVVSMSSIAGLTGTSNLTVYCSSKFAVKGLMDSLMHEKRQMFPESKVEFTTIHPYTVDTGLAQNPVNRFDRMIRIHKPDEAASLIIDSVRRNEEYMVIPSNLMPLAAFARALPRRVQFALNDFLGAGVDENSDPDYLRSSVYT